MSFKTIWRVLLPFLSIWLLSATAADAMFLSADPIGTKDDPNLYLYVGQDPVNLTDPTGMAMLDPGDLFATAQEAAIDAIAYHNQKSIDLDLEIGGTVEAVPGGFTYAEGLVGSQHGVGGFAITSNTVLDWHTHGNYSIGLVATWDPLRDDHGSDRFSTDDLSDARSIYRAAQRLGGLYEGTVLGTPSGAVWRFDPGTGRSPRVIGAVPVDLRRPEDRR